MALDARDQRYASPAQWQERRARLRRALDEKRIAQESFDSADAAIACSFRQRPG
ncbi:MAG: hypothetical protein ACREUF_05550 [Solimonas sp.]